MTIADTQLQADAALLKQYAYNGATVDSLAELEPEVVRTVAEFIRKMQEMRADVRFSLLTGRSSS